MTRRAAALLLTGPPASGGCPPGVDPAAFASAVAEDVADLLSDLASVQALVLAAPARRADALGIAWSPDQVVEVEPSSAASGGLAGAFAVLKRAGFEVAALVAPDAPDLPGLVVAKTFSAVGSTSRVAAAPAPGGGLVVLACRLPAPDWLTGSGIDLDTPDAVDRLRAAAPRRSEVIATPGWHRLRTPGDIDRLDPGLEGWEATRALLRGSATGTAAGRTGSHHPG